MMVGALRVCAQNSPRKSVPSADWNVTARCNAVGGSTTDSGKVQPPHCDVPCSTVTPGRVNSSMKRRPRTNMTPPVARPTTDVDVTILANHRAICDLLRTRRFIQTSACLERETTAFVAHLYPCRVRLSCVGVVRPDSVRYGVVCAGVGQKKCAFKSLLLLGCRLADTFYGMPKVFNRAGVKRIKALCNTTRAGSTPPATMLFNSLKGNIK